jgi:hypothetical protein
MSFDPKFLDEILKNYKKPEDVWGKDGISGSSKKPLWNASSKKR